jgi:hypothetical protein
VFQAHVTPGALLQLWTHPMLGKPRRGKCHLHVLASHPIAQRKTPRHQRLDPLPEPSLGTQYLMVLSQHTQQCSSPTLLTVCPSLTSGFTLPTSLAPIITCIHQEGQQDICDGFA